MAKSAIGRGQFSGRLGGDVFVIRNGQQIIRSYQPVVANPKSMPQRLQRSKANLVGQISKITPFQILEGLGSNKVDRRSRFLKLALKNATTALVNDDPKIVNASLAIENFIFSEGAITPTMTITNLTATANNTSVSLTRLAGVTDDDFNASGALVVVIIMQESGEYESVLYRFVSSSDFSTTQLVVNIPHINEGAYVAAAFLAPFKTTDGKDMSIVTGKLTGTATDFNALMSANPSSLPIVWGDSNYYRQTSFTPNSKSEEEEEEKIAKRKK